MISRAENQLGSAFSLVKKVHDESSTLRFIHSSRGLGRELQTQVCNSSSEQRNLYGAGFVEVEKEIGWSCRLAWSCSVPKRDRWRVGTLDEPEGPSCKSRKPGSRELPM